MDINDFWQENKRFCMSVAGGVIVFFTSFLVIHRVYGSELTAQEAKRAQNTKTLNGPLITQAELDLLRVENQKLQTAHQALAKAAVFEPRPAFAAKGSGMANRYYEVVAATRDELLPAAGRAGIPVPENLGLPALAPIKDEHIARTLEGLDLIDRTLRLAFEAGIGRIEGIEIKLDPNLLSGKPLKELEKTLVTFKVRGRAPALERLVFLMSSSPDARVGVLDRAEFLYGGAREDDARLELTLAAIRLHETKPTEEKKKP
ncbi:MAG TPA: hypothetical protein VM509_03435 [Planctomycetota bacterium]|nr:hypothetical protein [Planctomycetota bacterium]